MAPAPVQQKRRETAFGQQLPSGDPAHSCCQRSRVPAEGAGGDAEEQQLSSWSILATPALHFSRQDFVPTPRGFCTSRLRSSCASSLGLVPLSHRGMTPCPTHAAVPTHSQSLPGVWGMTNEALYTSLESCGQEGEGRELVGHSFGTHHGGPRMHLVKDHQKERNMQGF